MLQVAKTLRDLLVVVLVVGTAYAVVFSYRTDYLGHFLGGMGGTLGLLALAALALRTPLRWTVPVLVVVAILIGVWTESTIFRLGIFDPIDFYNQSLGAALAGGVVVGRRGGIPLAAVLAASSFALLVGGFYFAFA